MKPTIIRTLIVSLIAAIVALTLPGCADKELERKLAAVNAKIEKVKAEIARNTPATTVAGARTGIGIGSRTDAAVAFGGGWLLKEDIKELARLEKEKADLEQAIKDDRKAAGELRGAVAGAVQDSLSRGNTTPHVGGSPPPGPVVVSPTVPKPTCFVAGTPVRTPSGWRAIEEIAMGDVVLSFDEHSGKVQPAMVTRLIVGERADVMVLATPNGTVTCAQNHRFYTSGERWAAASALSPGEKLVSLVPDASGVQPIDVIATPKNLKKPVAVHNFECEGTREYFVGPDSLLCTGMK